MIRQYQVHCPKTGRVLIKYKGEVYKFDHNEIVDEQEFFSRHAHIFKLRPDLDDKQPAIAKEQSLVIDHVGGGWYQVLAGGDKIFPEGEGNARKSACEEFISSH
jgi:hypothetical protein